MAATSRKTLKVAVNRELKITNAIKIPEESRIQSTFPNLG